MTMRVLSIFGTRPEAVKMAPVLLELERHRAELESIVCVTAQHRQMLDQVLSLFEIHPHVDLDLMVENQSPASVTAAAVTAITDVIANCRPDLVLVQGDTTTAMVAALAAFYAKVAVGHIEAGLRTDSRYSPFPEEINRRLISVLATYHFAPTDRAAAALRREGVAEETIFITGNPGIDALRAIAAYPPSPETARCFARLNLTAASGSPSPPTRLILVTAHRRENFGEPLRDICAALRSLAARNPDVCIVLPVHFNPSVRSPIMSMLAECDRVHLLDPVAYETMVKLLSRAYLVLTDSGGVQEEAPALGKPVLVLRDHTERQEGVELGGSKLVGTSTHVIVEETERLLHDQDAYRQMAQPLTPYGDGQTAPRIVDIIRRIGRDRTSPAGAVPVDVGD